MYHKGDIEISEFYADSREDDGYEEAYRFHGKVVICLPHSCSEWIIGGTEEAEQMVEDLKEAINSYKEKYETKNKTI